MLPHEVYSVICSVMILPSPAVVKKVWFYLARLHRASNLSSESLSVTSMTHGTGGKPVVETLTILGMWTGCAMPRLAVPKSTF